MERYWCLRWIRQQGLSTVTASVLRDDLVRLENARWSRVCPGYRRLNADSASVLMSSAPTNWHWN